MRPIGGQAVQLQRLLTRLNQTGKVSAGFVPTNPELTGLPGTMQRIKYVRTFVNSVAFWIQLLRTIPKFEVVHVFSASYWSFIISAVPPLLIGRIFGKRVILNYRSGEAEDHLARWRWLAPRLMRLAHAIVVPSDYLVGVFAKFGLTAQPILNFVDVDKIPYRERTRFRPVFLSNRSLQPLYNVPCIVRAFHIVQRKYPDARLIIAGDGPERPKIQQLVTSLALRNVEFRGSLGQEAMWRTYDDADIYLNSPNIDNMPGSVLEAFAAGVPVVSTDPGGIPFIVNNGETGLLCAADDDTALANHAISILEDFDLGARLSQRARRELVERYTWTAVEAEWLSVYCS
jgi:glycosyltransferase involved in cell wall biosynthesis